MSDIRKAKDKTGDADIEDDGDDSDDDEDDEDYEYTGGDLAIYDSALDEVDELIYVKDCLERLNQANAAYVGTILGGLTPEEMQQF